MVNPNYTKQDAINDAIKGFSEIKPWVNGNMIFEVAQSLNLSHQTVRRYVNGKGIDGPRARLHSVAGALVALRSKVEVIKSLNQTPTTA